MLFLRQMTADYEQYLIGAHRRWRFALSPGAISPWRGEKWTASTFLASVWIYPLQTQVIRKTFFYELYFSEKKIQEWRKHKNNFISSPSSSTSLSSIHRLFLSRSSSSPFICLPLIHLLVLPVLLFHHPLVLQCPIPQNFADFERDGVSESETAIWFD